MKIALICRVCARHRPGGMPFVLEDRTNALIQAGHEVHILTTGGCSTKDHYIHFECKPMVYSKEFADYCARYCKWWRPDITHFDSFNQHHPWWTSIDYPTVTACTLHGFAWGSFFTKWNMFRLGIDSDVGFDAANFLQERNALDTFNKVIAISRHEQWMLHDLFGIYRANLVYNPIHPCFFETDPIGPPEKKKYLCAAISGQGTRLFDIAEKAAAQAGVEIIVVSKKQRTEMPTVYDGVTALVVPTAYSQGYDLTVAESLARRRPVIVSRTGSYLREAEVNLFLNLVPLGDVDALAQVMQGPLRPIGSGNPAYRHRPEVHATSWLNAILS